MASDYWPLFLLFALGGGAQKRAGQPGKGARGALQWAPIVKRYTAGTPVPTALALAIIQHESAGNPNAQGRNRTSTDWGLMQLNDSTLATYGITPQQALDPDTNIRVGVALLHRLYAKWGDWRYAIAAYHMGSGAVQKVYPNVPQKSVSYIKYVFDKMRQFEGV